MAYVNVIYYSKELNVSIGGYIRTSLCLCYFFSLHLLAARSVVDEGPITIEPLDPAMRQERIKTYKEKMDSLEDYEDVYEVGQKGRFLNTKGKARFFMQSHPIGKYVGVETDLQVKLFLSTRIFVNGYGLNTGRQVRTVFSFSDKETYGLKEFLKVKKYVTNDNSIMFVLPTLLYDIRQWAETLDYGTNANLQKAAIPNSDEYLIKKIDRTSTFPVFADNLSNQEIDKFVDKTREEFNSIEALYLKTYQFSDGNPEDKVATARVVKIGDSLWFDVSRSDGKPIVHAAFIRVDYLSGYIDSKDFRFNDIDAVAEIIILGKVTFRAHRVR